jgi:PAS domain-containing protein
MALRLPGAWPIRRGWAGLALVALALIGLWLAIGLTIRANFRNVSDLALRETANLARILDSQIAGKIEAIDATLRFGQTLFARDPAGFSLGPWSIVGGEPAAIAAVLVGPDGFARATRDGPLPQPIDVRDRPNTAAHLADPQADRLEIGRPLVGPATGRQVIAFSRPLRTAEGGFGGVLILAMDAALFSRLHQSLNLRDGRILLIDLDGVIYARVPETLAAVGSRVPDVLVAPFRAGTQQITAYRTSTADGTPGFVTWRRVAGFPLVVTIRLAAGAVLADARLFRLQWFGTGLLLTLVTCGLCWALARKREAERRGRAALEGSFAHVGHGIMMVDAAGKVVLANARASELLGLPPGLAVPGRGVPPPACGPEPSRGRR